MKSEFETWYADQITKDLAENADIAHVKVDLLLTVMKPLGAKWITKMYDNIRGKKELVFNGFKESGIADAVNYTFK